MTNAPRVVAMVLLLLAGTSSAGDRAAIEQDMRSYYGGERRAAFIVTGLGGASLGTSAWLFTQNTDFARGLRWTLLPLGVLEVAGGISYAYQVGAEIDHYQAALDKSPAGFRDEELGHIKGTTSRFIFYRLFEATLTLSGIAAFTYGALADQGTWRGVGVGLFSAGLPLLIIDTFNNNRAIAYTEQLEAFSPSVGFQLREDGWTLGLAAKF